MRLSMVTSQELDDLRRLRQRVVCRVGGPYETAAAAQLVTAILAFEALDQGPSREFESAYVPVPPPPESYLRPTPSARDYLLPGHTSASDILPLQAAA